MHQPITWPGSSGDCSWPWERWLRRQAPRWCCVAPPPIPGGAPTAASNDSVLRFYAVWWAAQGPAALSLARDPGLDEGRVRFLCLATFLGGLARVVAMRTSGLPNALFGR